MVSRRDFLKVAVAGIAGAAVGAGADRWAASSAFEGEKGGLQAEIENLRNQIGQRALEKELKVYNWSEYINMELLDVFEKDTGVKVIYDTFETTEENIAKMLTGASGYDLTVMGPDMIKELQAADPTLLQPIDISKISNFDKYCNERFKNPEYDKTHTYSVPYTWGSFAIAWNTNKVTPEVVDGLEQLFDEKFLQKYKGKVTMPPDMSDTMQPALIHLGYQPGTTDETELRKMTDLLKWQKQFLATYADATAVIPGLISEEFWVSYQWPGPLLAARDKNPAIKVVFPKEGVPYWVDNMVMPKGAVNVEAAHAFMNYIWRPEVMAIITNTVFYANTNSASTPMVIPSITEEPCLYPNEDLMRKLVPYLYPAYYLTPEMRDQRSKLWEEIMAA
jgi:spermidine/putrescine-binding protein